MKTLFSFIKKEFTEQVRSGKLWLLFIIFILFGIMNPAIAKLTPWLLETLSDSLAESGMTVTSVTVTALDSWVQFFKNIPMGLIVFIILESSIFTKEYASGTLLLSLTKGLERYKVVVSKAFVLSALWTVYYVICFGITYLYSAYFWDNSVAQNLVFSVVIRWLFGMFVISLTVLFSVVFKTNTSVLAAVGGCVAVSYLAGFLPKIKSFVPTYLTDGNSLIYGLSESGNYTVSLIITLLLTVACVCISIPLFNKKQL
ncbi:MAG: ABC transporter permease subunit [Clostridia bacterium]|nr:ABC transporter permease subunit [Clostridia bacterium]MBQ6789473.1 ABC transporter permease subunit [Clostridia bacterium]